MYYKTIKLKFKIFDHFQKLLPLLLYPMTLATSEENAFCDILSQETVICLLDLKLS